jgi:hypothetical protein
MASPPALDHPRRYRRVCYNQRPGDGSYGRPDPEVACARPRLRARYMAVRFAPLLQRPCSRLCRGSLLMIFA